MRTESQSNIRNQTTDQTPSQTELTQRIDSLDLLRGFALLGILLMNVQSFGLPLAAYVNPFSLPDHSATDRSIWFVLNLFADSKFMNLFSMLFGVGIVVFGERAIQKSQNALNLHQSRMQWLLMFGVVHAYFIWWGDILFSYAVCGLMFVGLLQYTSKRLLIIAIAYLGLGAALMVLTNYLLATFTPQEALEIWRPSDEILRAEIEQQTESWMVRILSSFEIAIGLQFMLPFVTYWRITALMIIGVLLYRNGFLSASLSRKLYLKVAVGCLVLGTMITSFGAYLNIQNQFSLEYSSVYGAIPNWFGSVLTSIGYAAVIMLLAKSSRFYALKMALRAVGKTAFSNYIFQSLVGLLFFSILGYFATLDYVQLMLYVCAVWLVQVCLSIAWLSHNKQGPLEALWRRLTYKKC